MRRSLAILSEGRLSDSQREALTLLSLGWLAVAISLPEGSTRKRKAFYYVVNHNFLRRSKPKPIKRDKIAIHNEEIMAIIRSFVTWEV